jgi:hypothetical protein
MTRDEAFQRNIRRLLASTAEPPASKRKRIKLPPKPGRESEAKRRARALRKYQKTRARTRPSGASRAPTAGELRVRQGEVA